MKDIDRQLKELEELEKQKKQRQKESDFDSGAASKKKSSHPLLEFFAGMVLLGGGIYWVLNSFVVSFSWGSLWGDFGISTQLTTGLMLVPLLVGIGLAFFMERKLLPGIIISIGILIILITLLTSVRFHPVSASLWQYILMFGMIAAGAGLLAKTLLKSR